jgi:hypothetical protein
VIKRISSNLRILISEEKLRESLKRKTLKLFTMLKSKILGQMVFDFKTEEQFLETSQYGPQELNLKK